MPWTAAQASEHVAGLSPAQARKWATIANASLASCQKRGGDKCEGYALATAAKAVGGGVSKEQEDEMANHLATALRELDASSLTGKEKQGERARLLGTARAFGLTEGDLLGEAVASPGAINEVADLHEAQGVAWDAEAGVARNVKALGIVSKNGREYSERAQDDAVRLAEGAPVFQNHSDKRQRQEAAGFLRNARRSPDGVRADWYVPPSLREDVAWAITHNAPGCGMSINGQGKIRGRGKGMPALVEEITALKSVDFVAFPATCNGLSEEVNAQGDGAAAAPVAEATTIREDNSMDEKVLEQLSALQTQLADVTAKLDAAEAKATKAEAALAKTKMVEAAVAAHGKTVPAALRGLLERCDTREEMDGVLAALPTAPATNPPAADTPTKPVAEAQDKAKEIEKGVAAIFEETRKQTAPGFVVAEWEGKH